jgi:hypothetical protein
VPELRRSPRRRVVAAVSTLCCAALLGGCAQWASSLGDVAAMEGLGKAPQPQFQPGVRYLRVTVNGRATFVVLGFVEGAQADPTEVWFSGSYEVVRLRDGLLAGTGALPVNWVDVRYSMLPDWSAHSAALARDFDLQPGYRFGQHQDLRLDPIPAPAVGSTRLVGIDPTSLHWFALTDTRSGHRDLYATQDTPGGGTRPFYGEQCLDASFCLTWERWPLPPAAEPRP